ncbi:hypothetical protein C9374_009584 [Naegleria lovaniensis]|uniref:t-SNARE coiled-coil homology domain-containing protein n=1 Tax=Naegleria lovaniensis TaxID=51637 RepID=A0AA88KR85_NAELO|nr:uncharacterized protein C9374_009584 [Naegleria lovaniensis]KAG2393007.1 hypothetical protein C9374_009584 [Naegleria lovaniensis]
MKDSEQWLVVFDDTENALNKLAEEVENRNQIFRHNSNAGELPKLNSEIRRQFKSIERVLIDLKETLPQFSNELSQREITRRKDALQNTIQREQQMKKKFDNPSIGRNKLLAEDNEPISKGPYDRSHEPESIRDLESNQILAYQQRVIDEQDKSLDLLSHALDRTKQIGLSIDEELDEHSRLLEDIHENVDVTESKIKVQTKKMVNLAKKNSFMCWGIIIAVILFIIASFEFKNNREKMSSIQSFLVDGTPSNEQDYVLQLTIPDDVMNSILQNPDQLSLKFLSDPLSSEVKFEVSLGNKKKEYNAAIIKNDCDLYRFSENQFHQIGTIKHRANLDNLPSIQPPIVKPKPTPPSNIVTKPPTRGNQKHKIVANRKEDFFSGKFKRTDDSPIKLFAQSEPNDASTSTDVSNRTVPLQQKDPFPSNFPPSSLSSSTTMPESPRSEPSSPKDEAMPISPTDEHETSSSFTKIPKESFEAVSQQHKSTNASTFKNTQPPNRNSRPQIKTADYCLKIGSTEFKPYSLITEAFKRGINLNESPVKSPSISKIDTFEQYNQLKKQYNELYPKYESLDMLLNENVEEFKKYASQWQTLTNEEEKRLANSEIQKLFVRRQKDVLQLTNKYKDWHKELETIKHLIEDYVQRKGSHPRDIIY